MSVQHQAIAPSVPSDTCCTRPAAENAELKARLEEAEETLRAIHRGEVDALVVESATGPLIYTLQGMDAASNRFRGEILAQVSDAVMATDSDQRITYVNAAAERQYGISASSVLGRDLSEVYEARWLQPGAKTAALAALRERGEWCGENIHVTHDGRELDVEFERHGAAGDRRPAGRDARRHPGNLQPQAVRGKVACFRSPLPEAF